MCAKEYLQIGQLQGRRKEGGNEQLCLINLNNLSCLCCTERETVFPLADKIKLVVVQSLNTLLPPAHTWPS